MKRYVALLSCIVFLTGFAHGAIFHIPEDLVKEQRALEAKVHALSNAETRFELAMNYAYTGWIEIAWEQLSMVPDYDKNYADKVLTNYTAKLQLEPNNWKHHFKIAFAYYFQDKKEAAIRSFKKVVTLNPKQVWAMGLIALLYGEQKNYATCISWCKKALAIEPNATAVHFLYAKAQLDSGDYFGFLGESMHVVRLKSAEAKYTPTPPE
ncbi:hypothetical protein HOH87_05640 [bacterium]|jgi:tetratricopeptide (TPR) repeat protein|nr:hypothetical protein [bacterium]